MQFSEEQIIGLLKQTVAVALVNELCRQCGFSDVSFYSWRAKFSGTSGPDAKWLKKLEVERACLKRLLA